MNNFHDAEARRSENGELTTSLRVAYAKNKIGNDDVDLRSFDGGLVGPTLRAKPGDTMNIRLVNDIVPKKPREGAPKEPTRDIINFHTHGLHVSPAGNSDNVLVRIEPKRSSDIIESKRSFDIEVKVPKDHPTGTFWYHSHVHGSTAIQVASGLAGALIIEGDIDQIPEIKAAEERIFVLQQAIYDERGQIETHANMQPGGWFNVERYTTVNGVVKPTIRMRPGEVHRWRLIHSGFREVINLQLEDHQLHEIAVDGLTTGRIDGAKNSIELYPGYRSDVLVKAGVPGTYILKDLEIQRFNERPEEDAKPEDRDIVAIVIVEGEENPMALPTEEQLAPFKPFNDIEDDEITGYQSVHFRLDLRPLFAGKGPPLFQVDNESFHHAQSPRHLMLGAVEEWQLTTNRGVHPFHIHVNPFQVVKITDLADNDLDPNFIPVWRDTFAVSSGQKVIFRTRYTKYIGKFVLHCHILDHEDQGMMQLVEVVV